MNNRLLLPHAFKIWKHISSGMKNTIKVERARKDLTQEALAEKIGVSRQTINSIEKGKYVPSTVLALKMSAVFEVPVNEFMSLDDED